MRFLVGLAALAAVLYAIGAPIVASIEGGRLGLVAGLLFSVASFAVGYHWIRWGATRGGATFTTAVLGGVLGRLLGLLVFALVLAFGTTADVAVGLLTAVGAHFVLAAAEIVYLSRTGSLG